MGSDVEIYLPFVSCFNITGEKKPESSVKRRPDGAVDLIETSFNQFTRTSDPGCMKLDLIRNDRVVPK
jgi:hypothetical protein